MTTLPRLYVDAPLAVGGAAPLSGPQAHYLKNVLRRGAGDRLFVFNGRDGEFAATIAELGKKGGAATIDGQSRKPEPEPDLWLLFAPVKRDAVDLIAQKATELGAARLVPVVTERTNAARVNVERLAAIAIEAAEQCGRLAPPPVDAPQKLAGVLLSWPDDRRLVFCDEAGDDPGAEWGGREGRAAPLLEALAGAAHRKWAILIGPEGGFTAEERAQLRRFDFVTPATLGPRILRADTAAIAAIALWQAALGDFRRA